MAACGDRGYRRNCGGELVKESWVLLLLGGAGLGLWYWSRQSAAVPTSSAPPLAPTLVPTSTSSVPLLAPTAPNTLNFPVACPAWGCNGPPKLNSCTDASGAAGQMLIGNNGQALCSVFPKLPL